MSEPKQPSRAQQLVGDFAPKLAELTDEVLFGDVWARPELSPRDRSLVTVAALIANGNTEQLSGHLLRARENGLHGKRAGRGHHSSGLLCRLAPGDVGRPGGARGLQPIRIISP
ncbi:MAG: hypothetical protein KatS3mg050_0165 [Litorilinea sp.]|nr:MAG: hypothetical protein KatS3mg050_0165 [Litorilinea sp.]